MVKNAPKIEWDAPAEFCAFDENPAPANGQFGFLKARDGKLLRNSVHFPDGAARGTIVLMTGYSEFIEKYFETISDLLAMGYCVATLEWRGHGLSEGMSEVSERLHLDDFDQNIEDMEDRFERLVLTHCPAPCFGLAHSMGGQISFRGVARHPDWFVALAQSAPMLGIRLPLMLDLVRRAMTFILLATGTGDRWNPLDPPVHMTKNPPRNNITHDEERFERGMALCLKDPRLLINGRSLGWSRSAFAAMAETREPTFLRRIKIPVFIGTAGDELLVDNAAHAHAMSYLPDGQGKIYANAMHEILMETDATRQAFLADVDAFFTAVAARRTD